MKEVIGLVWLWAAIQVATSQCVLENEFFCSSIPNDFPEGLTSVLFVVTNLGVINATLFSSPRLASVTSLALANSGITSIEPGAFDAFQSLTKLSLYQNRLTHVGASWLSSPGRLENFTVARNLIARIEPGMFSAFSNLTTLNLANNRIHRIAKGSFEGLSRLRSLDLSGNNLTTLTKDVFGGLTASPAMKFGGNPWNCSCELQDFGLFLQELINASLLEDAASIVCRSPPSLEGVRVWNISDFSCPLDILPLAVGNGFHKVGLPALLACLVFISFSVLLVWLWLENRSNKQVRPSKDADDMSTCTKPSGRSSSVAEGRPHEGSVRATEGTLASAIRRLTVRANSASAVLLRTEFHQKPSQATVWVHANPTAPYVSLNNTSSGSGEALPSFVDAWDYQKLRECDGEDALGQSHATSFLTKVCVETPATCASVDPAKQIQQDNRTSGTCEDGDGKDHSSTETPEPFLYLSVATAAEEQVDPEPQKDVNAKAGRSHLASLKRALTWPPRRDFSGQKLTEFRVRGTFTAQYCSPPLYSDGSLDAGKPGLDKPRLHGPPGKEHQLCIDGESKLSNLGELAKGTDLPFRKESNVEVADKSIDVEKTQFGKERPIQHGLLMHLRTDDQIHGGRTELNAETKAVQCGSSFQKESKAAVATKCGFSSRSGIKATKGSRDGKIEQPPKPVSSQSEDHHEIRPTDWPSVNAAVTSSPHEDNIVLLENNDQNYINLLYEVVENRGRWTRERWKQTHQLRAMNQLLAKPK